MNIALAGNQNCGKTTLFNQLTGSNQHVGNFPGVTVDKKEGVVRGRKGMTVVDLPGIYSLSPYSSEEIVTRDYLIREHPDAIINIVDAGNIERNLYLSLQLLNLDIPMVIALNMMDEVRANGGTIKTVEMSKALGVPVVPISASSNEGIGELIEKIQYVASRRIKPVHVDFCGGAVHRTIHSITHLIEDHAQAIGAAPKFAATKLAEGDTLMLESLHVSENEAETIEHTIVEMEAETGTDRKAAIADMRYAFIEKLSHATVVKPAESRQHKQSVAIDRILTGKYTAIPVFLLIMALVFWLTFGVIGSFLSDLMGTGVEFVTQTVTNALLSSGANPVIISLVSDGILAGVGSVLSFLPTIITLFLFLSLLEDSGYMARVAFVMDKLLRKIGLSGKSFVPMLIGFGCSVPAIMSTRTLTSERDRRMTIFLVPFMSCSAKLPIYAMFTMAFFPKHSALVMIILYITGMALGILTGLILNKTAYKGHPVPFVMELPNYRLPSPKTVVLLLWDKTKDFLQRAFTLIFVASLVIWFLNTFGPGLNTVTNSDDSMLAGIGKVIAPVFAPLGFGDWRASTALITGLAAKEAVISTLAVLTGSGSAGLVTTLSEIFTPLSAFSFLIFTLLYTPCVAAIGAYRNEMKSTRAAVVMVFFQIAVAWVAAFIVYQVGLLIIH